MEFFGIPLDIYGSLAVAADAIESTEWVKIVTTPNPEILLQAQEKPEFSGILRHADFRLPDGIGLYLSAQVEKPARKPKWVYTLLFFWYGLRVVFGKKTLEKLHGKRIPGSTLSQELIRRAALKHQTIAVIDNECWGETDPKYYFQPTTCSHIEARFVWVQAKLYIWKEQEAQSIAQDIITSGVRYVFVTLGNRHQEVCMERLKPLLTGNIVLLGIGSSIDYITGFQKRPPAWASYIGFEWLYRLLLTRYKKNHLKRIYSAVWWFYTEVVRYNATRL